jgi:inorganic triphosphatase YgiF
VPPFVAPEIELKLAIDPPTADATIAALKRHPAIRAAQRGRWRRARLVSTYYDTPDAALARRASRCGCAASESAGCRR